MSCVILLSLSLSRHSELHKMCRKISRKRQKKWYRSTIQMARMQKYCYDESYSSLFRPYISFFLSLFLSFNCSALSSPPAYFRSLPSSANKWKCRLILSKANVYFSMKSTKKKKFHHSHMNVQPFDGDVSHFISNMWLICERNEQFFSLFLHYKWDIFIYKNKKSKKFLI